MVAFDGAKVETLASPACTPMRGRCASASSKLLQSDGADHRCISGDGRVTLVESREAKGRPARVEPSVERRCEAFCWRRPANSGEPKHLQRRLGGSRMIINVCFTTASNPLRDRFTSKSEDRYQTHLGLSETTSRYSVGWHFVRWHVAPR
jgi:hypothetical protein